MNGSIAAVHDSLFTFKNPEMNVDARIFRMAREIWAWLGDGHDPPQALTFEVLEDRSRVALCEQICAFGNDDRTFGFDNTTELAQHRRNVRHVRQHADR